MEIGLTNFDSHSPVADSVTERRDSNEDAEPGQAHSQTISAPGSCSIESAEHIPALQHSIAAMNGPEFECPLCARSFRVKKTLVRHVNVAIGLYHGSPFVCRVPQCGRRFARNDIRTRHERFQHDHGPVRVACAVCGQQVRPRSLKGHQDSQACFNAGNRRAVLLDEEREHTSRRPDDSWDGLLSLRSHLHDILDCVVFSSWMFVRLKPWGPDEASLSLWLADNPPPLLYEVEKLKFLLMRTMRQAVDAPDMPSNGHLLDAIAALKLVTTMTQGWRFSNPHSDAYKKLAHIQITQMGLTQRQFIDNPPSQAWDSILTQAVPEKDRRKCKAVITQILRLMRLATWDSVSYMTENFTRPLDNISIMKHTRWNTRETFFRNYGAEIVEVYATASSVGQQQRPVSTQC